MTDRAALLAAVLVAPDDDTPRLVYADWCDDHGEPTYARFIRTQVALARVPAWDRFAVRTHHRERDLFSWRRYNAHSAIPLPLRAGPEFRRGFPWGVELPTPQVFADRADELFALAPFQSLTIRSAFRAPPPDLSPLTADPRAARLRRLTFNESRLGAADVGRLADSPHLAGVTELSFEFDGITRNGADELGRSGFPARLTRLRFNACLQVGAGILPGFDGLSTLRSLAITNRHRLSDALAWLLFRGLVELDLSGNSLGPAGCAAVAASPVAGTLESLTLDRTTPGVSGVRALAGSAALANLRRLGLRGCGLGQVAAKALAGSPHLRNLAVLDLRGNAIRDTGAVALAESPHLRNLAALDLFDTGITDRGAAALLDSPVSANLEWLRLSGNLSAGTVARLRERFGP